MHDGSDCMAECFGLWILFALKSVLLSVFLQNAEHTLFLHKKIMFTVWLTGSSPFLLHLTLYPPGET